MSRPNDPVRVRFAPSPTGFLHIGSARSALFNWLFARHEKGIFLLRIEDTDRARSKEEFLNEIMMSLRWLGMDWDEEPVYQSQRSEKYRALAEKLIKEDKAYREGPAVRLRMPRKKICVTDLCRGQIEFDSQILKDEVLIKSDGFPAYNFACVVDDADMHITHVIRGDDHISNTPKQLALYEALGYSAPCFAHIPLIMGPDGGRLSKRHGATSIGEYRDQGYLSEAMVNFLALMAWSPGNDRELMRLDELVGEFSLARVNNASAVFDINKLTWMNAHYIKNKDTEELVALLAPGLQRRGILEQGYDGTILRTLIDMYKIRMRTLNEFADHVTIFYEDTIDYEETAVHKHLRKEGVKEILRLWKEELARLQDFSHEEIEKACRNLAERLGIKPAKLIHPTRAAISGRTHGAGLFEMMEVLGRETVLRRLNYALDKLTL